MARTQARIANSIWTDPDWLALTDNAQRLYLLLLSQPRLNIAGCIDLMPARWARLSASSTADSVNDALGELVMARFVVVDDDEMVVRSFVANDVAAGSVNRNLVKGMWSAWAAISSPVLRKVVVDGVPDSVWSAPGVEVPPEALELRSEPQLELPLGPQSEPWLEGPSELRIEPPEYLKPESGSLNPLDSQSESTTPLAETVNDGDEQEPVRVGSVVDEQSVRRTANLVGRAVAAGQAGVANPTAYAARVTATILAPDSDGLDLERITAALISGETPEAIAEAWQPAVDPFGLGPIAPRPPEAPRPALSESVVDEIRHQTAEALGPKDQLAKVRELRQRPAEEAS